jgi:hypothetical protein
MVIDPTVDDAIGAIAEQIRTRPTKVRQYGYDVYLPRVWNLYAIDSKMVLAGDRYAPDHVGPRVSPTFILLLGSCAEAVFCGPVSAISRGNLTAAPVGYSITPTGERWLASDEPGLHIPTEPSRLAAILTGLSPKFGPGFCRTVHDLLRRGEKCPDVSQRAWSIFVNGHWLCVRTFWQRASDRSVRSVMRTQSGWILRWSLTPCPIRSKLPRRELDCQCEKGWHVCFTSIARVSKLLSKRLLRF